MKLSFEFQHMEASAAIQDLLTKKTEKFQKYVSYPLDVKARVGIDATDHYVELTCHAERRLLVAEAKTNDVYEAIDLACAKMETQLKKEREKRKGHEASHKDLAHFGEDVGISAPHLGKKAGGG
jgi:putative sigma-54 modulation protein